MHLWRQRPILGWALYDWANSAFALTVMTSFVPLMLGSYWNDGAASTVTTFRLGLANSIASLIVALLAPLIGTLADRLGRRKGGLLICCALGVVMTGALFLVAAGQWPVALVCFVIATIGFATGNSLYDSLLLDVATESVYDWVSAYGFALGYLGSALLFSVNVWMVSSPETFGFSSQVEAIRFAFLMVAVWWALFTIPLLLWVHPRASEAPAGHRLRSVIAGSLRELIDTVRDARARRDVWLFLVAYWLYIDGVYTIIKMAVDFGSSIGLAAEGLITAILVTNFVGFPAALLFGVLGQRIGARTGLYIALSVYIVATTSAVFITTQAQFFALAVAIGIVQGGVQSLSRSLYARLIPSHATAKYFGFYNMLGKFAAILGPVLTGTVALVTGSQRIGILSILLLFVAGLLLLRRVSLLPAASPA